MIPFNKPYLTGKEIEYISNLLELNKLSGNGYYTQKCHEFFETTYDFNKCLLTTSCTDALEMAAILVDIQPGDEVIMPSYTFVSTANAFVLRGAKIIFVDSRSDHPGMDENEIEKLITPKTKVIVPVHYAGVACNMDKIMEIAVTYNLFVIEDAAQAIDSYYIGNDGKKRILGSIGHLSAFSFHETKNIISGEGGMLVINEDRFKTRAEVIWEKGTNRASFFRGEVDKYGWVDLGSSFLPSEIIASFLFAQLESLDEIQNKRLAIWNYYNTSLESVNTYGIKTPFFPSYSTNNAHMYYLVMPDIKTRTKFIDYLKQNGVHSVFHYLSLHKSPFYHKKYKGKKLKFTENYANKLVRLPLYASLSEQELNKITQTILTFCNEFC